MRFFIRPCRSISTTMKAPSVWNEGSREDVRVCRSVVVKLWTRADEVFVIVRHTLYLNTTSTVVDGTEAPPPSPSDVPTVHLLAPSRLHPCGVLVDCEQREMTP